MVSHLGAFQRCSVCISNDLRAFQEVSGAFQGYYGVSRGPQEFQVQFREFRCVSGDLKSV